jgi:hypothetical protein
MRWWRRLVAVLFAAILVLGLGVVAVVVGVNLAHPRDESAYVTYLRVYGDTSSDDPVPNLAPRAALLAAGDAACGWLSGQEFALWRTSRSHRNPATTQAYLDDTRSDPLPWTGPPDRSSVAVGAWTYLCPATRELHEPHDLFRNQPGD